MYHQALLSLILDKLNKNIVMVPEEYFVSPVFNSLFSISTKVTHNVTDFHGKRTSLKLNLIQDRLSGTSRVVEEMVMNREVL